MEWPLFVKRSQASVVIQSERQPRLTFRTTKRRGMPVKRFVGCVEYDKAIEGWRDTLCASAHVILPKLKLTAPLFPPSRIEIEQRIHSAMKFELRMNVEVRMDLQEPTRSNAVNAASQIPIIWHEIFDTGEAFDEAEDPRTVELLEYFPGRRREQPWVLDPPFALLGLMVGLKPGPRENLFYCGSSLGEFGTIPEAI